MKKSHRLIPALLLQAFLLMGFASACNKSSDPSDEEIVVTPASVAISKFNLKADTKVLADLDSVFFSIDLNKGVIFNADSLPKGTKVSRLIPVVTFANTMTAAELVFTDSLGKEQKVNYLENQNDSIDFSKEVTLNVTAADGESKYSYRIKVNVHNEIPDSMIWDKISVAKLPSRKPDPIRQKTTSREGQAYTILEESDHTFTLAKAKDNTDGYYSKVSIDLTFSPDLSSFTATPEAFWMLDESGMLYTSADGTGWDATGQQWISIVGPYLDSVLGLKATDKGVAHCHYPASGLITDTPADKSFPLTGRSALVSVSNNWTDNPTAFFIGGKDAAGNITGDVWAFDGSTWTTISDVQLPALDGAALVKYVAFKSSGNLFSEIAYEAWFAIGGRLADGSFNRKLYYSLDNGVKWKEASELMELPSVFPSVYAADAVVLRSEKEAGLSGIWTPKPSENPGRWFRLSAEVEDNRVIWQCPYIYMIGGTLPDGTLSDEVWRGVLARLSFTPLI